ncbi:bifunctional adenosylcobinamide kinase/adenosylcobinamide-phosphate guanylyltransferase [uncultured Alcanivorax sp.]|jgi:adenosylcobinamide kinase/adenosylcobinamide-phosphate guanylyltransferase|uniref:bifunctional adenosylcobinamide kinase/adenosylcobinamide-phosphate guanylyltransferase n=1 Tax=uncultured Alcanivorax sp. TaxID=191215 RepID=UPI00262C2D18|nr:bifunctional adenosylcobinamide kinase/adenosylcobinamide-phosphate guanylyltransferase [uncultured Alcanivorax sp.]
MTHSLILGGIRSGKSSLAERLVSEQPDPVVYVATATAGDGEMSERIRRHQRRRPVSWGLVEEPVELGSLLNRQATLSPPPCVLIDCMSLWVSNLLHAGDALFVREKESFLTALAGYPGSVVIVSNEVGLGTIGMDPLTRRFADELGWLNQALAKRCDRVVMSVAGIALTLKG